MMLEMAGCFMNNTSSSSGQVCTGVWPPPWIHHGRRRSKLQACPCEITWLWPTVWMKFRRRSRFYWPRSGWANLHFTGKSRMTVDGELTSHFNFTLKNKHSGASGLIKCKLFLLNVVFRPVCVSVAWTLTIKTLIWRLTQAECKHSCTFGFVNVCDFCFMNCCRFASVNSNVSLLLKCFRFVLRSEFLGGRQTLFHEERKIELLYFSIHTNTDVMNWWSTFQVNFFFKVCIRV